MKKLLLSVTLLAFAAAVQAGDCKDSKVATSDKPACCARTKTMAESKGACSAAKSCCCQGKQTAAKAMTGKQPVLLSPKAASAVQ